MDRVFISQKVNVIYYLVLVFSLDTGLLIRSNLLCYEKFFIFPFSSDVKHLACSAGGDGTNRFRTQ